MPVSILHIGLPLDHPSIPAEERLKIAHRLAALERQMGDAGYRYEVFYASPGTGLDAFRHHLTDSPADGVLIGGAIAGDPAFSYFMEQIIDTTHAAVPAAKIMFYSHAVDVPTTVARWFPHPHTA